MKQITYKIDEAPNSAENDNNRIIEQGLVDFNDRALGERGSNFSIYAMDNANTIGGLIITKCSDAFYIQTLWLHDNYQKKGIGTKLIEVLTKKAKTDNILKIFVNTYGFQAPGFYEKQGFKVIGIIPKYILGYDKICFKMEL